MGNPMANLYKTHILRIDLTTRTITREPTFNYSEKFIGGRGINAKIMFDEIKPQIDPLGVENIIVFGAGPLTGTLCPGSSRVDVMSKSPVTGFLGDSNMGGNWPAELKYAGYDHVVIHGKADHPVYIAIENEKVEILDASHLWGADSYLTSQTIRRKQQDSDVKIVSIGKAGEKGVSYASLISNIGNAAGRNGMGAVLGSKNLKAIAVRGTRGVQVANPEEFFKLCTKLHSMVRSASGYDEYSKRGSLRSMTLNANSGYTPAGNHQTFGWGQKAEFLDWWKRFGVKRAGCFGCPVQCAETYTIPGIGSGVVSCQHYIEPTWKLKNNDVMLWWEFVRNCQLYGVDVISISGILAWVIELYEEGIISKEDTDGLVMRWGDRDSIIKMMEKIINREGIGDILAKGFKEAIKHFGRESEHYAMHVKNSPLYAASPRFPFVGLETALGPRGDYMRAFLPFAKGIIRVKGDSYMSMEEKEKLTKIYGEEAEKITGTRKALDIMGFEGKPKGIIYAETMISIPDMLGVCKHMGLVNFQAFNPDDFSKIYSAGLGKKVSPEDLIIAAIRNRNVERAFEAREGLTRAKDTLPEREFNKEVGGAYGGVYLDQTEFEKAKDEYYALRGWDIQTGIPTEKTLVDLGLEDIAEDFKKRNLLPE
jgi:aldehyde:ferredoxin oxidoreductase